MTLKVQIDNYRFTYFCKGDLSHPAILFLHGFMGDCTEFEEAIADASKQFYCVAINLPAHGETPDHGETNVTEQITEQITDLVTDQDNYYTIQSTANLVIKFLGFLRIERCFLVGYSMGGRLALYLAIYFPQYFRKVVLESASAGLRTATERSDRLAKDQKLATELENLEHDDFRLFLENWYQQSIFASLRSHPNFPQMLEKRLNNSPSQLAKSLRNLSIGMQPSLWESLPENEVPLLLLVGALDLKFVQINQQMQQLCKLSQLEIVPNCGHNIHFENPNLFIERIQSFFKLYSNPKSFVEKQGA